MRRNSKYLLLCLLLLAGIVSVLVLRRERAADPLIYLPGDTLALVDLQEPAAMYGAFRDSGLGRSLARIAWQDLLLPFGASEEEAGMVQADVDATLAFLDSPMFRELFGRRAVLALLPSSFPPATGVPDILASLVLISQPRHGTDVLALLSPLLAGSDPLRPESYHGWQLQSVVLNDQLLLSLAVGQGLLIASFSPERVRACLDLAQQAQGEGGLQRGNPGYLALRRQAADRDQGFVYGDLPALARLSSALLGLPAGGFEAGLFRRGAFFCDSEKDLLRCGALLQAEPGAAAAGSPQPEHDVFLAGLPAELLLHFWTNLVDAQGTVALLRANPRTRETVSQVDDWFRRKCGMDFADFLSLFHGPLGCTVTGVRGNGFFPLPRFCCRLGVRDEPRLQQALAGLFADKAPVRSEVAGVRIHSVPLAGGLLQPSWGFKDGFLLLADSPEQIGQSLGKPTVALVATPGFRQVDVGLAEPNNLVSYVDVPRLVEGLRQAGTWVATLLAMTDEQRGRQTAVLFHQLIVPILDGLRLFTTGTSRLVVTPGEIVMESALLKAGENKEE